MRFDIADREVVDPSETDPSLDQRPRAGAVEADVVALERVALPQRAAPGLEEDAFRPGRQAEALEITEVNQRVLLHRARSRVRRALEEYLAEES